uniref:Geminin coiled-coil domain containing n=2 Tax=Haplochromis burtoni TaxID=8153 RepID=A0A3Q2VUX4_HAPBU
MLQALALGPDTVDCSMETLASVWVHDPVDLSDLGEQRDESSPEWESHCVFDSTPPAALMWTEDLSPHLQRNKQLQDTLLQREEELARLQEENNKLRAFLNSSFVRNLEQKAKKLTADGRRKLKRSLACFDSFCGDQRAPPQQISKRVCRNLTAQFCSESLETSACSEPNLDLWVLRTLGLKDRDTIDTSEESSSEWSLRSLVYDTAVNPSSFPECNPNSSFGPPVIISTDTSVHSYCQRATHGTSCRYSAAECQEANCENPPESASNCPDDFTATRVSTHYEFPEATTRTYSAPSAETCSLTAFSQVQTLEGNPADHHSYWSSLQETQTPSQHTIQFNPPAERVFPTPVLPSGADQPRSSASGFIPTSPCHPPAAPHTPRNRTDLAFSMSLSPSSSVKTHSFPQGQAFVRKDVEGRWNFTWVPRQEP